MTGKWTFLFVLFSSSLLSGQKSDFVDLNYKYEQGMHLLANGNFFEASEKFNSILPNSTFRRIPFSGIEPVIANFQIKDSIHLERWMDIFCKSNIGIQMSILDDYDISNAKKTELFNYVESTLQNTCRCKPLKNELEDEISGLIYTDQLVRNYPYLDEKAITALDSLIIFDKLYDLLVNIDSSKMDYKTQINLYVLLIHQSQISSNFLIFKNHKIFETLLHNNWINSFQYAYFIDTDLYFRNLPTKYGTYYSIGMRKEKDLNLDDINKNRSDLGLIDLFDDYRTIRSSK